MEVVKLALIFVLLLSNVLCQEVDVDNWRESIEMKKCPSSDFIKDILLRMTRKPETQQSPELMRRKSAARSQTGRKRYKFHNFVGLMGKRSFDD